MQQLGAVLCFDISVTWFFETLNFEISRKVAMLMSTQSELTAVMGTTHALKTRKEKKNLMGIYHTSLKTWANPQVTSS